MTISEKDWSNYIRKLRKLSDTVADKVKAYIERHGIENTKELIDYSYALVSQYGEGAAALSAQMYDILAELEGRYIEPAEMAPTATYGEVAKSVNGTLKTSQNPNEISGAVSRWVKMAGSDTTLKNAERDGAQFAWIPSGDTCAFCLTLASRGWQYMSKNALKNGHAEHIHSHCDCQYAVRFDSKSTVAGYDPDKYRQMYENAEGDTPQEKINSMRRAQYEGNKDEINAKKRAAYAKNKEKIIGEKERLNTSYSNAVQTKALDAPGYIEKFQDITGIQDVDNSIYECTKLILDHRNGTNFEDLYLIDANSGKLIHKLTTCDKKDGVIYDDEINAAIEKAHREGREIIAIHNHPGGLPPTLDDGVSAFIHKYKKGIAVGHNLEVYVYSPSDQIYTNEQCDEVHDEISRTAQFSVDFEDDLWYNSLRLFGMEVYRR